MECGDHLARSREMLPEVQHRRRRPLAIASLIALQAATIVLVARRSPPPQATTYAPQMTFVAPSLPPPDPGPRIGERPSCPPPRRDAPWVAPMLDEDIVAVRPAPSNAGWIAAFNREHVFVSFDAGATFARVLDGDGAVNDVSFDCYGHVIVLRGNRVGIRDGEREKWRDVQALRGGENDPGGVLGGGPDVVVVGNVPDVSWEARLAVSDDLGATWSYRELAGEFESDMRLRGRQQADGTIDAAISVADCMSDELVWSRWQHGAIDKDTAGMLEGASFAVYGDLAISHRSWRTRNGDWHDLALDVAENEEVKVVPGAFPVLVAAGKTFRIGEHGQVRELPLVVEGEPQAVDLAGRVWSVACGKPLVAKRTPTDVPAQCAVGD
jgi:hypothetical protein